MEYYKNLSLEDLFYIDDDGLICSEEWRDIPDYIGRYQASDLGRIKSLERIRKNFSKTQVVPNRIFKQADNGNGYLFIVLCKEGLKKNFLVSIIVAKTFLNHTYSGFEIQVDHINTIKKDNRLCNLNILTHRENNTKDRINKSGHHCIKTENNVFRVCFRINKKTISFGSFKSLDDALEVRNKVDFLIKNNLCYNHLIKPRINNNGIIGVTKCRDKYCPKVTINKKSINLGYYYCIEKAKNIYNLSIKNKDKYNGNNKEFRSFLNSLI